MGRLKTARDKMEHKKVVHKHVNSGRTYNYKEGFGWSHFTKGFRRRTVTMDVINKGCNFIFSLMERVTGTKTTEEEVSKKLNNVIESLKGAE